MSARHNLYAVEIGAALINGITQLTTPTGTETGGEAQSGEPFPRHKFTRAQKPRPGFTTTDIETALTASGTLGVDIAGLSGGLKLYAQKRLHGGTRTTGANHRRISVLDGLLLPRQLSCEHQQDATLSYEALATYDGTNDPLTVTDGLALPAGLAKSDLFTLGPIDLAGETLSDLTSLQIDFGIEGVTEGAQSAVWDDHASISDVQVKVTISGKDVLLFKAAGIPLLGTDGTHANTSIALYKRAAGSTLVAGISLTMAGLVYMDNALNAAGIATADDTITMEGTFDGTNNPIVLV